MSTGEVTPAPVAALLTEAIGTGRRKKAVARVRIRPGSGTITVNKRTMEDYFPVEGDQRDVLAPLLDSGRREQVDVLIRVAGGGLTGQAGACRMGIARALVRMDPELYAALREKGHLTRDSRRKERKKYGLHGARRGTQFSKR